MAAPEQLIEQQRQANVLMQSVLDVTRQQLHTSMAVSAELEALLIAERSKTAELTERLTLPSETMKDHTSIDGEACHREA